MKRLFLLLAVASPLALIPLHAGCSGQTEGQYCTLDEDCNTGLTCISPGQSTHSPLSAGVCCTSGSTIPACLAPTTSTTSTTTTTTTTTTTNQGGGGTGGTGSGGSGTGGSGTGGSGTGGAMNDAGTGDGG